jgi:hypothetical protein
MTTKTKVKLQDKGVSVNDAVCLAIVELQRTVEEALGEHVSLAWAEWDGGKLEVTLTPSSFRQRPA